MIYLEIEFQDLFKEIKLLYDSLNKIIVSTFQELIKDINDPKTFYKSSKKYSFWTLLHSLFKGDTIEQCWKNISLNSMKKLFDSFRKDDIIDGKIKNILFNF